MVVLQEVRQSLRTNTTWPHSCMDPEESCPFTRDMAHWYRQPGREEKEWEEMGGGCSHSYTARKLEVLYCNEEWLELAIYFSIIIFLMFISQRNGQCQIMNMLNNIICSLYNVCLSKKHTTLPPVCMTCAHQPKNKRKRKSKLRQGL